LLSQKEGLGEEEREKASKYNETLLLCYCGVTLTVTVEMLFSHNAVTVVTVKTEGQDT
jgi:hypothetical protein